MKPALLSLSPDKSQAMRRRTAMLPKGGTRNLSLLTTKMTPENLAIQERGFNLLSIASKNSENSETDDS